MDLSTIPARVDRIKISGLKRTKDDYVQRAAHNLFKAKSFKELTEETNATLVNLTELGIFKYIHAQIDVSKGDKATPNGYEITFIGEELKRVTGAVGTEIGHNEGSLKVELNAPNIAGRGERVGASALYSNAKATDINVRFSKPFYHTKLHQYKPEASFTLFKRSASYPWSKYNTNDCGALFEYSFLLPTAVRHSLQYEWAIREIGAMEKHVPFFVRENCGPRLASVLRHIGSYDKRDSKIFPTYGVYVNMTNELSGLGGNISYIKNETHGEINVPLFGNVSAQLTGRVGIIQSDKNAQSIPLSNMFILGGPLNVRGFLTGGIGDHVGGASVGAQTFWASGLHIWSPLPFNRHFGMLSDHMRIHFFSTLGNVNSFNLNNYRCSVGCGLAFRIGGRARIELNYCKPIHRQGTDVGKEGFQFGIGCEFL